eukprot:tig00000718_g3738.t1
MLALRRLQRRLKRSSRRIAVAAGGAVILLVILSQFFVDVPVVKSITRKSKQAQPSLVDASKLEAGSTQLLAKRADDDEATQYCTSVPLFIDVSYEPPCRKPILSIVFVTKRPGGYDVLFNSLAAQTSQDYEIVIVDELAAYRGTAVMEMAKEKGIPCLGVIPSRPKSVELKGTKFGIYKALNTGLLLISGEIVTILMDFSWVPPRFVERTIEFYREHPKSFLAYPEIFYGHNDIKSIIDEEAMGDFRSLLIFKEEVKQPPSVIGGKWSPFFFRPQEVINRKPGFEKQPGPDTFWEMSFASAPWSAYEALNGLDEFLDVGDDCHEIDVRLRAELIGYDLWIDGQSIVENIQHRIFSSGPMWQRYAKDNNWERFQKRLAAIRDKQQPIESANPWSLRKWRQYDCPRRLYPRASSCPAS